MSGCSSKFFPIFDSTNEPSRAESMGTRMHEGLEWCWCPFGEYVVPVHRGSGQRDAKSYLCESHAEKWSGMLNDTFKGPNRVKDNQIIFKWLYPTYVANRRSHVIAQDLSVNAYTLTNRVNWYMLAASREKTQSLVPGNWAKSCDQIIGLSMLRLGSEWSSGVAEWRRSRSSDGQGSWRGGTRCI